MYEQGIALLVDRGDMRPGGASWMLFAVLSGV